MQQNLQDPKVRQQISEELVKKFLGRAISVIFMNYINDLTDRKATSAKDVNLMMNAAIGESVQALLTAVVDFGEVFNDFTSGKMSKEEAVSKMGGIDINEVNRAQKDLESSGISISKDLGL